MNALLPKAAMNLVQINVRNMVGPRGKTRLTPQKLAAKFKPLDSKDCKVASLVR